MSTPSAKRASRRGWRHPALAIDSAAYSSIPRRRRCSSGSAQIRSWGNPVRRRTNAGEDEERPLIVSASLSGPGGHVLSETPRSFGRQAPAAGPAPRRRRASLSPPYCVSCHNPKLKTAESRPRLPRMPTRSRTPETWEKVVVQLRTRAMPPPRSRRPDSATYDAVAAWLETELDPRRGRNPNPGRTADLHRLNRAEYANAMRDLLGVQIDGTLMLPPDEQAHGFDTNADALSVVPALLDRYLTAAAKISRLAIGDPTLRPAFERYTAVEGQLERADMAVADGAPRRRVSAGIARRHRGAPLFPGRRRVCLEVRLDETYHGHGPRPQHAERDRNPRRRQARGAVHAGRPS